MHNTGVFAGSVFVSRRAREFLQSKPRPLLILTHSLSYATLSIVIALLTQTLTRVHPPSPNLSTPSPSCRETEGLEVRHARRRGPHHQEIRRDDEAIVPGQERPAIHPVRVPARQRPHRRDPRRSAEAYRVRLPIPPSPTPPSKPKPVLTLVCVAWRGAGSK